jgi:hypothetical protein
MSGDLTTRKANMEQNTITSKQALEILAQAAAQFRGTRQEHEIIERALRTLAPLVEPAAPASN